MRPPLELDVILSVQRKIRLNYKQAQALDLLAVHHKDKPAVLARKVLASFINQELEKHPEIAEEIKA